MSPDYRPHVLVGAEYYLPGDRGGGPIRSISNLVRELGTEIRFSVVTRDRDLGSHAAYEGIRADEWSNTPDGRVLYTSPARGLRRAMIAALREDRYDAVYLNSYFATTTQLLMWRRTWRPRRWPPFIVAPRGEFASGALGLKQNKKKLALLANRAAGSHRHIVWHATTDNELRDIRRTIGEPARIVVATNLASSIDLHERDLRSTKAPGSLRIVTAARISPMKNILKALEVVAQLHGSIEYDIIGPLEDREYVKKCEASIAALPPNVRARLIGRVAHSELMSLLPRFDVFLLPTLDENFGHAIAEALAVGLPVLISDRTPWRRLAERNAGWDVALSDPSRFVGILGDLVGMDRERHQSMRHGARALAAAYQEDLAQMAHAAYRTMFTSASTAGS